MDAGYLLMTVTDPMMLIVILRVKEIADGSLCFLFELEDLDNICFLPVAGARDYSHPRGASERWERTRNLQLKRRAVWPDHSVEHRQQIR